MSTPVADIPQPPYPSRTDSNHSSGEDDEGTVNGAGDLHKISRQITNESARQTREQQYRLDDDLAMLQAERVVSAAQVSQGDVNLTHSMSMHNTRSRREEPLDAFDAATNPIHEKTAMYKPPEHPTTKASRAFKRVHNSSYLVRYFVYILPIVIILLVPLLLGALLFRRATVGGVRLLWFSVWLEIVWLTLWAGRIVAKILPYPIGLVSSLFTNNSKKWRDMGKQLEVPATIFFWALAVEISFLPTMTNHHINASKGTQPWEVTMNKCLASLLVLATLNFIEKIIIQLIAISFHLRTYADRIEINKFQIGSLTKLYQYSRDKIAMEDSDFEEGSPSGPGSGARTPMQYLTKAQKNARGAFSKVGDVAGKVAGDFMGRQVAKSTHPHQVVLTLLNSPSGSQVLARRLWRTFVKEDADTVDNEDLKHSFDNDDEAEAAFNMFDKDLNGDISMEELEAVCVEIGRERKSITASLKDLDSVVSKLDAVLLFIVVVITILVFTSLISTSAAGVLGSAGSAVLGLSWLFSATAQDFLQSVMFVLVKHPFDVGDRVSIYGNTGAALKGDDYFVKEISLLYTEFKKMEGHVVQAPNSYLNTLFILNQRRSGGLAEAVPLTVKFGTTLDQVDQLRQRLLEFVKEEKREYQGNILTEIRDIVEAHSLNLNVVFFYKSNWQNELLRLQRRNKFICAMMVCMQELGIEGPRMRIPGQKEDSPFYVQHAPQHLQDPEQPSGSNAGPGDHRESTSQERPFVTNAADYPSSRRQESILRHTSNATRSTRARGESVSVMSKRVDFSLGMRDVSSGDLMGDIFQERIKQRVPDFSQSRPRDPRNGSIDGDNMRHDSKLGRTTSRENQGTSYFGLHRASTESQTRLTSSHSGIHHNRFFRRDRQQSSAGVNQDLMEQGMADIPENGIGQGYIDARTGIVSTQALRVRSEDNAMAQTIPMTNVDGRLPPWEEVPIERPPGRSQTDSIEMRRFK